MKPCEVAIVVGKMKGGGVEATVMSYVEAIDRSKVHFTLLVDSDSTQVPEEQIRACGADLIYIPPYQQISAYQRALGKIFQERHFDVIHAHINTLSVFPLFAAWRARIPVRIVHNHATAGRGETKKNVIKYILRPFSKVLATKLCACGQYAGEWIYGKRAAFTVMPNAIDFKADNYAYCPQIRAEKRQELSIDNALVIGHVGRFIPQKNHTFLIDVFAAIHQAKPSAKLLLVGSGALMDSIKEKATRLGLMDAVVFMGQRQDVPALYQAMDILLMPSLYEGKPLVPIEAQTSGLPILASNSITKEIIVREELVRFLPLRDTPETWSCAALALLNEAPRRDYLEAMGTKRFPGNALPAEQLSGWYCALKEKNSLAF